MRTQRITDYCVSGHILDKCFYEISEDGVESYTPDLINEFWIGLYKDELIGCYRIHPIYGATYEIHAFILPEHRKEHSKESGKVILKWCLDNTEMKKLVCMIPDRFKNVIGFVKSIGFVNEGCNRLSYTKDGQLWDVHHFGLTRDEIEGLV